ncbi:MAG: homogentisate 1,2-dioxygenase [Phycisphaerales bacterium]|nr:homogentisate 1,2-dioxygenase [Phycisphaerales bacterium]
MIHRYALGQFPAKPHTAMYENRKLLMEQMVTREGFHGPFSILYFRRSPTDEISVDPLELPGFCPVRTLPDQPLRRRHILSQELLPVGDFLTGRRTLLVNSCLQIGVCKPAGVTPRFFSNGDGDECWFVKDGAGTLESVYGVLPFRPHDYLLIPKGTPYRLHCDGPATLLVFEGRPYINIPKEYRNAWGQLSDSAPFSHRDFRVPQELLGYRPDVHGAGPFEIVMKRSDRLTLHRYEHFPHEIAGWDGILYPVAFNIHDYQPKTGLVHLPPTIHTTFSGPEFVICSFVPRVLDYHPQAIPCPYAHASVDMDEILYYVEGNFTSRKGVGSESISLHPAGVTHGPHPGTYEASIGVHRTDELAVMCDCYPPLQLTAEAAALEDPEYHLSWVR